MNQAAMNKECPHYWISNSGRGGDPEFKKNRQMGSTPVMHVKCQRCGDRTWLTSHQFCIHLLNQLERRGTAYRFLGRINQDITVAQQAAWIEWMHGKGAKAGMQWIQNTLAGPGLIPSENAPYGKEAQAYFDANKSDPFPTCFCGRPSNQARKDYGACCDEHMKIAGEKWKENVAVPASKRVH